MTNKIVCFGIPVMALLCILTVIGCHNGSTSGGVFIPDPETGPIELYAGKWTDGKISESMVEQWFKFTASGAEQYIHIDFGTLTNLDVEVLDSSEKTVNKDNLVMNANTYTRLKSLSAGKEYKIRVCLNNSGISYSGTYSIAFNDSFTPPPVTVPSNAIQLTANTWADGNIPKNDSVQWFRFTATDDTQYIHADFNSLTGMYVKLYNSDGNKIGNTENLSPSNPYTVPDSLAAGQMYYINVLPSNPSGYGVYRIVFNESNTQPAITLPSNAAALNESAWADAAITAEDGVQWYKFTASGAEQYIHAGIGTLTSLYIQVYDSTGIKVGNTENLSPSNTYAALASLTSGQDYYIKVLPYSSFFSGTYQIAFNTTESPPALKAPSNAIQLTVDAWTDGNIPTQEGVQWFRFTASAAAQYIHFNPGTLSGVNIQLYDNNSSQVGAQTVLDSGTRNVLKNLTSGQTYYIKVSPYISSFSGTYCIAFNAFSTEPIIQLTANVWTNGNIASTTENPMDPMSGEEQWFKFIASAATQYIHVDFGSLYYMSVELFDSNKNRVGDEKYINSSGDEPKFSCTVTPGQTYYLKIKTYQSNGGTYRIAFNTSTTAPAIPFPANAIPLSANIWTNGNIPVSGGEQWFKFTATANDQYILFSSGIMNINLFFQLYNSDGIAVGSRGSFYGTDNFDRKTVTAGNVYYIKVILSGNPGSGTYRITFNTSSIASLETLPTNVIRLIPNTWKDVTIHQSDPPQDTQWFIFTATASIQYLHIDFSSTNGIPVQLYNSSGIPAEQSDYFSLSDDEHYKSSVSWKVTIGQEYYVKAYTGGSGTFKITFNESLKPPSLTMPYNAIPLTENTWAGGTIDGSNDTQWFKFTATASTQYIHVNFNTMNSLLIQLYNTTGIAVGGISSVSLNNNTYISRNTASGQIYYIKVTRQYGDNKETYNIAFNGSMTPPSLTMPSDAILLTANTWADGIIKDSASTQWFKFTATAAIQYIHANIMYMNINFQLYDNGGIPVGNVEYLDSNEFLYASRPVTQGQTYYIKVFNSGGSVRYQIGFTASDAKPVATALPPDSNVTTLSPGILADGSISSSMNIQWFKFNATAVTQYIHAVIKYTNFIFQLYNSSGIPVGDQKFLYNTTYVLWTVTPGQTYYIKVSLQNNYYDGVTYRIAFNELPILPVNVTALIAGVWYNDGNIPDYDSVQWFKFTAADNPQNIYIEHGTLDYLTIQLYDSVGNPVGNSENLSSYDTSISRDVTAGQMYYIRVNGTYSNIGTFRIEVSGSE